MVPWVAVLGWRIRYDVVLGRFITLAVPLAVVNVARGIAFMDRSVEYTSGYRGAVYSEGIVFQADLVLLLADASEGVNDRDLALKKELSSSNLLCVLNKTDLVDELIIIAQSERFCPGAVPVSAKTGAGIRVLQVIIDQAVWL